jgi:iron(III) transport system substrate-binding protein|tara:strand:+ start:2622 stop:3641 length:1020 start_codon:yes stop_codon:yes gene_type:complete
MNTKRLTILSITISTLLMGSISQIQAATEDEVTVYSSRKEHLIQPLFEQFTKQTGIEVNYLTGSGSDLIERLKLEGSNTPADMFMTVDAGDLWYAGTQDIFQSISTETIKSNIPSYLRDPNGLWTGLSVRARTIVYSTERVNPNELSTYSDLASNNWNNKLCLRTSKKIYTKSLVASIIHNQGEEKASEVINGWVNNLAAVPNAKDSHVMDAIIAGQCDVGLVNTYYFGRLIEKTPDAPIKLFWANQETTGVHVNVSGAGITKHASNPSGATQLLEWLSSAEAQSIYGSLNKEYPANQNIGSDEIVSSWGSFKQDKMNLSIAGELQADAVKLMQRLGYK